MGPRGVTTGDDILEVGLDLRGVAHEKGCYHRGAKGRSNAGITYKLEMVPLKTWHGKSAVCGQEVAMVKTWSLEKLWRCDGRQTLLEERLTGLR